MISVCYVDIEFGSKVGMVFYMLQGWKGILQFNLSGHGDHDWWGAREIQHQPSLWKLWKAKTWWWVTFWSRHSHSFMKELSAKCTIWSMRMVHASTWSSVQKKLFCVHLLAAMDDRFVHHCVLLELDFQPCHGLWWIVALNKLVLFSI